MMLFTVHRLLPSSRMLLHTWPAHSPSHALDSYLPFGSESCSLQPQTAPQHRDGSSGAWIWKPLKERSKGRPSPPHLLWGKISSAVYGGWRSDHGKRLWSEPRSAFAAITMKCSVHLRVYISLITFCAALDSTLRLQLNICCR